MKYIIVILTTILFMSCNETIKNVESIEVYYIRDGVNYPIDINCEAIRDKGFDEIREVRLIDDADLFLNLKFNIKKLIYLIQTKRLMLKCKLLLTLMKNQILFV